MSRPADDVLAEATFRNSCRDFANYTILEHDSQENRRLSTAAVIVSLQPLVLQLRSHPNI